ncbi:MAG: Stp1/IreP family PP2C-type Ser/Thr phosphatase [Clostridiales bacterium]|nr:Stp1/IreP family PP2C-type Ser/Thr phosphatase [Clostridiales bacterium]
MFSFYAVTDTGRVRSNNEDSYFIPDDESMPMLCVVADGMGGYNCGEVASKMAVDCFVETFYSNYSINDPASSLYTACDRANKAVYIAAQSDEQYKKMGTTLVACMLLDEDCIFLNVGDSRGYVLSEGSLRRITRDHSAVQEFVDEGIITPQEAKKHPQRNIITRAIGTESSVEADTFSYSLSNGDIILLCSDGLTEMVDDVEIEKIIRGSDDISKAGDELMARALENGGVDNITAVLVKYEK